MNIDETGDRAFHLRKCDRPILYPNPMIDDELHTQNAQDYAEIAQFWARRSQRYANSIDLPAAMSISIAINLLITCLLFTLYQGSHYAIQCR